MIDEGFFWVLVFSLSHFIGALGITILCWAWNKVMA